MGDIEELKFKIDSLTNELDQTTSEKNQAAQYGLVLLEEKESLQTRCEELEACYENARHELKVTQEVISIILFVKYYYFIIT